MGAIFNRKLNSEVLLKILILNGFALFLWLTIHSGNVQLYVHPRILPYMKFGSGVFIIISLFLVEDLFKPGKRKNNLYKYLIFLVPLFLFFMVPPKVTDAGSISFGKTKASIGIDEPQYGGNTNIADKYDSTLNLFNYGSRGLELKNDSIIMEENNFVKWIQEMQINIDKYTGKRIETIGFVYKDKELGENQFVVARLMMACCAADAQPVGLLSNYSKTDSLKKDEWIKVYGKVEKGNYKGQIMPVINVEKIERVEKAKFEYIYP